MIPNKLNQRIEDAREHLEPRWDETRAQTNWDAIQAAGERSSSRGWMVAALAAALLGAVGLSLMTSEVEQATPRSPAPELAEAPVAALPDAPGSRLTLADGTTVRLADGASFERAFDEQDKVDGTLEGKALFDVPPAQGRHFVVHARGFDFRVLGTRFELATEREGVRLSVEEGKVEVSRDEVVIAVLVAGEARSFSGETRAAEPEVEPKAEPAKTPARTKTTPQWRELVEAGDHTAAYEALEASRRPVADRPEVLMQAADAARLSGHPREALEYLDRVAAEFPGHALAPLAAFTAGRTRLDRLGDARAAARSFERARALAPTGSMAQDALAREVEAWSKAGEAGKARSGAEDYLKKYPEGRRLKSVKLHGGLD